MKLFDKVAVVGVGLIGGSMALAIKKNKLAREVVGVSRHKKSIALAKRKGAIDKGSQDLNIIKDADLVILSTPVKAIIDLSPEIAKIVRKDCIVIDVGSTKKEIVDKLDRTFLNFLGSHPLAGLEKRSIKYAYPGLFKNSFCILTPTKKTSRNVLYKIKRLWRALGAKTILFSPDEHDKILSFVSHLPHVVAFSLMGIIPEGYLRFGATGLRDTTRIAASDAELWTDILLSNRNNIVNGIELLQEYLSSMKLALKKRDHRQLNLIITKAKQKRDALI